MVGYFRDDYMVYFILDFIRGKELFEVIRDMGKSYLYDLLTEF